MQGRIRDPKSGACTANGVYKSVVPGNGARGCGRLCERLCPGSARLHIETGDKIFDKRSLLPNDRGQRAAKSFRRCRRRGDAYVGAKDFCEKR